MTGQRRTKRRAGCALCLAALAAVCAAPAALAQDTPATRPDDPADLAALARQANVAHWSEPVVLRFDGPDALAEWKTSPEFKPEVRGGQMVICQPGPFVVYRPLPAALRGARGLRMDLWIEVTLNGQMGEKIAVMLDRAVPEAGGNPEYRYEFAHGQTGNLQQFIVQYMDRYTKFQPLPQGRMLHVYFEVAGASVRGRRQDCPELRWDYGPGPTLDESTHIGLTGTCRQVRLRQLSLRRLAPGPQPAEREKLLAGGPFGGQAGFDRFVTERLIPRLNSERFSERQAATELLRELLPLSSPAIQAALDRGDCLPPETQARLRRLRESSPTMQVLAPVLEEAPGSPAATAPDEPPQTGGNGAGGPTATGDGPPGKG